MDNRKAYSMTCGYFEYLKSMGTSSPCEVRRLLVAPLLADMTEGELAVWQDEGDSAILNRIALSMFL